MNVNFIFILTALTFISGIIYLVDVLVWKKQRAANEKQPKLIEYARSFFPVFIIVLVIRSFVGQIFHVPTGSLEPTIAAGDFIIVTQYNYGLHFPVFNKVVIPTGKPKRGDIVVFHWPVNPKVDYIKRLIGLPGDHISYINRTLYINGKKMTQTFEHYASNTDGANSPSWPMKVMQENLNGVKHGIYICADENNCPVKAKNFYNMVVPKGEYFFMGDNRDNSEDGRSWGFVTPDEFVGKGQIVLFSWNAITGSPRWNRIGTLI
tara:strand:- start:46497 stop:47285 length:789 start_codon:yes stop_codon:yes gene_type:complete